MQLVIKTTVKKKLLIYNGKNSVQATIQQDFHSEFLFSAPSPKYQRNDTISPTALCIPLCNLKTQAEFEHKHPFSINIRLLQNNLGTTKIFPNSL